MLNYDLNDRIKRDQIRAQQAPGLSYKFTIYPSNIKNTLTALLQTQIPCDDPYKLGGQGTQKTKLGNGSTKLKYGQILQSHPLQDLKILHRLNESFIEPYDIYKLQELTKDVQVADQMQVLIQKKVRKRQLTGASIRDCFNTEGVYAMWRELHSNQGIIFHKKGTQIHQQHADHHYNTPERKKESKLGDSNNKLQRSNTKVNNKQLQKSQDRVTKAFSLVLYRDEPMTPIKLQKEKQKHAAAVGTICKQYHKFQLKRLMIILDLTRKICGIDINQMCYKCPENSKFPKLANNPEQGLLLKDTVKQLSENDQKRFYKVHRWKHGLFNKENVCVETRFLESKGHLAYSILQIPELSQIQILEKQSNGYNLRQHTTSSLAQPKDHYQMPTQNLQNKRYRESMNKQASGMDQLPLHIHGQVANSTTFARRDKDNFQYSFPKVPKQIGPENNCVNGGGPVQEDIQSARISNGIQNQYLQTQTSTNQIPSQNFNQIRIKRIEPSDPKLVGTKSSMAVSHQKSQRQLLLMDDRAILENRISHECMPQLNQSAICCSLFDAEQAQKDIQLSQNDMNFKDSFAEVGHEEQIEESGVGSGIGINGAISGRCWVRRWPEKDGQQLRDDDTQRVNWIEKMEQTQTLADHEIEACDAPYAHTDIRIKQRNSSKEPERVSQTEQRINPQSQIPIFTPKSLQWSFQKNNSVLRLTEQNQPHYHQHLSLLANGQKFSAMMNITTGQMRKLNAQISQNSLNNQVLVTASKQHLLTTNDSLKLTEPRQPHQCINYEQSKLNQLGFTPANPSSVNTNENNLLRIAQTYRNQNKEKGFGTQLQQQQFAQNQQLIQQQLQASFKNKLQLPQKQMQSQPKARNSQQGIMNVSPVVNQQNQFLIQNSNTGQKLNNQMQNSKQYLQYQYVSNDPYKRNSTSSFQNDQRTYKKVSLQNYAMVATQATNHNHCQYKLAPPVAQTGSSDNHISSLFEGNGTMKSDLNKSKEQKHKTQPRYLAGANQHSNRHRNNKGIADLHRYPQNHKNQWRQESPMTRQLFHPFPAKTAAGDVRKC